MQNTVTSNIKSTTNKLQNVAESVRDSAEQMAGEASAKAKDMASSTSEAASRYYGQASTWIQENYGKTLGVAGLVAAAGVIGYYIGRNGRSPMSSQL